METLRGLFLSARSRSRVGGLTVLTATFLVSLAPFNQLSAAEHAAVTVGGRILHVSDADPSLYVLGFASRRDSEFDSVRLDRHPIFRVPPIHPRAMDPPKPSVVAPMPQADAATDHQSPSDQPIRSGIPPADEVDRSGLSALVHRSNASPSSLAPPDVPRIASRIAAHPEHPGSGDFDLPAAVGATDPESTFPAIEPPRRPSQDECSVADVSPPVDRTPHGSFFEGGAYPREDGPRFAVPVPASPPATPGPLQSRGSGPPVEAVVNAAPVPALAAEPAVPVPGLGGEARVPVAVADRARQGVEEGIRLAERGAMYSARAQFVMALRLITQSLDAQTGGHEHSQALADGLQALKEAADFQPPGTQLEAQLNMPAIVSTHRTPVLKQENLRNWTAMAALQRYHVYAEQQLTRAGGRELAAADALYGLARLQPFLAAEASNQAARSGPVAMSLYQAALMVEPRHYLAANELGALFARYGQWQEAREALRHAVAVRPDCPVLWENLARVHQQLGERDLAQLALHEWQVALQYSGQPAATSPAPQVQWLDAGTFAELSPNSSDAPSVAPFAAGPEQAVQSGSSQPTLLPSSQDNPLSVGQRHDGRRTHGR